jgi:thiol-disulfide isomerase/thioredoxin
MLAKFNIFKGHATLIRKVLGIVIILTVLFSANWNFLPVLPSQAASTKISSPKLVKGLSQPYPAPNFTGNSTWINRKPLTMSQLKGKVVLVDFWTYSCVNCLRTLPYITSWDRKYRNQGLLTFEP